MEGPIIGVAVFYLLQDYLAALGSWYLIILGGLAIVLMVFAPEGVWGVIAHRFNVSLFPVRRRLIVATATAGRTQDVIGMRRRLNRRAIARPLTPHRGYGFRPRH